jgi:hypothetical protein
MKSERRDIQVDNADELRRIEAFWEEIDQAAEAKDVEQRRKGIEAVTAKLAEEAARNRTAPLLFLLGYAWYFHPDRLQSLPIQERLENALQFALELEPTNARAHMYLGHEAFDLRKHAEARSHFEKVELGQLGTYWAMKVREMLVCCAIAIDGLAAALNDLDEYVRIAEAHPPPDVWPTELHKWIESQRPLLSEVERERLRQLMERLDLAERYRK